MNGKERAALRAQANGLDTLLQIGKGGLTEAVLRQIDEMLTARELIKIRLLETSPVALAECADALAQQTGADIIQMIGSKIVLYRYSQPLHDKIKQKEANRKKIQKLALQKRRLESARGRGKAASYKFGETQDKKTYAPKGSTKGTSAKGDFAKGASARGDFSKGTFAKGSSVKGTSAKGTSGKGTGTHAAKPSAKRENRNFWR